MSNQLVLGSAQQRVNKEEEEDYKSVLHKIDAAPSNFNLKQNALEYDIKLGWIPRSQITGPIPLNFSHFISDSLLQTKPKSFLYLGYRPRHSFQLHQRYYQKGKNYPFYQFHLCKSLFLQRFFKKYYSEYEFNGSRSPSKLTDSALQFNSDFQGGNLDAAYYEQGEYRLLLRVDSNTQGHCNYYNFRVKANEPGKYAMRIMNLSKPKSLYQRGMRPYVRSKKQGKWGEFKQCDVKVKFSDSPLCQQFEATKLKSLQFVFTFAQQVQEYEFSFSIPYTYSQLLYFLNQLRNNPFLHFTKLCHTLSGVEIPLLTITGPEREDSQQFKEPYVIVITGRVHPSEANGSHIVNGVIKSLLSNSQSAKFLRKTVIFKIVPMLNPDGVIIGNTRTSFSGKDLNRRYYKSTQFVYPQINGIMDYVSKLKSKYNSKLLFLIDIHGHSARKNSFFYGPEYSIMDLQYARCRLLPRIFAQKTDIFRYYSCKYKVASSKEHTARGFFNSNGIRTYTHETSIHSFWNFAAKRDEPFTRRTLEQLGEHLVESLAEYVRQQPAFAKNPKAKVIEQQERPAPRVKGVDFQEDQEDSEEMPSSRDDSEDESQDFQDKKLQQFYNKINENREYFIEQLQAMEKDTSEKKDKGKNDDKKRKKSEVPVKTTESQDQPLKNMKREKIEEELIVKKTVERIDWAARVAYPQKKKFYQQYTKMSSVIFGSSIPSSYFTHEPAIAVRSHASTFTTTKYSVKYLQAQFKSNPVKYPSPEPKVYHNSKTPIKRQSSLRDFQSSKQLEKSRDHEKLDQQRRERYRQLKQECQQIQIISLPKAVSKAEMERLLSRPSEYCLLRPVPVCSVDLQVEKREQERSMKNLNSSLKVLTRKKSIKSIREGPNITKRNNNFRGGSLASKLPSLNTILKF